MGSNVVSDMCSWNFLKFWFFPVQPWRYCCWCYCCYCCYFSSCRCCFTCFLCACLPCLYDRQRGRKKLKPAKLCQFSMYWTKTGQGFHQNWKYRKFRPLYCTVLPSNSLKKEGLCLKIVLDQVCFELYCTVIYSFSTHSTWTRIGCASPP